MSDSYYRLRISCFIFTIATTTENICATESNTNRTHYIIQVRRWWYSRLYANPETSSWRPVAGASSGRLVMGFPAETRTTGAAIYCVCWHARETRDDAYRREWTCVRVCVCVCDNNRGCVVCGLVRSGVVKSTFRLRFGLIYIAKAEPVSAPGETLTPRPKRREDNGRWRWWWWWWWRWWWQRLWSRRASSSVRLEKNGEKIKKIIIVHYNVYAYYIIVLYAIRTVLHLLRV